MNSNNFTSQIGQLFNIKVLYSPYTLGISIALVLLLYPLLFDFSPDHWLIPLLGIACFTWVLTMYYDEANWNWMKIRKYANAKSSTDDIDDTIAPLMVTQFGKSNPANQIQIT